jgi:hypothetical protein
MEKLSDRNSHIDHIRDELVSVGNPAWQIDAMAKALKALREGDEVFHAVHRQFFIVQSEFSDELQVHVRHRDAGWQTFADPTNLTIISALQKEDL